MSSQFSDLLIRLQTAEEAERPALMMEFSLSQLPQKIRTAVEAAAIPHFFNRAFLNALLADPVSSSEFEQITHLSFIEPYPKADYFSVHEHSRFLILHNLWQENAEYYREVSQKAFNYCQPQDSTLWRVETLYHQLIADPEMGGDECNNTAREWYHYHAYDKVEILTRAMREHWHQRHLDLLGTHTMLYWEAILDIVYSRYFAARDKLQRIDLKNEIRPRFQANCLESLGDVYLMLSELELARDLFKKALIIYQNIGYKLGEADCLQSLGNLHLMLSELEPARDFFKKALRLYQNMGNKWGEARCLLLLGYVYLRYTFKKIFTFFQYIAKKWR